MSKLMNGCLICEFVAGDQAVEKIWEDESHLAFLTIYPNTPGTTVVTTKMHFPSDVFELDERTRSDLVEAAGQVAQLLKDRLAGVGRVALVFEGFGINHVHAKLYPLHGTEMDSWRPIEHHITETFDTYPGYITTAEGPRVSDEELSRMGTLLRGDAVVE